ncbi:LysR substrate-binding domain-containing protein [Rhizobium lemnae]|uniref:LysR substrate-binding domain-containing protein n=1 Tax=Rhizobium lemnae TaxID=1214924 RepID=A0ABV8EAN3_9HYPH|nr:LysR family transcriptional regulator [Rhizobium lemnae]MCJ8507129.1 LysR substrate-binding domain-containing protein [Rhizobium lemnae]
MDRFVELEVFTRIADEANLTRAAQEMGLSVSGVSRHLTNLETRLGVRLVQRTTRALSLTLEGKRFARSARDILAALQEAEETVSWVSAEPTGVLRIGASLSFGLLHLMPVITTFKARHPQVRVDLQVSNRYCDIIENGLDLAIRTRRAEVDSSVTMRKLAEMPRLMVATKEYLARNGVPKIPEDLEHHALLLYTLSDNWDQLSFTCGSEERRVHVSAELACNDGQLLRQAALSGMGLLVQPAYVVHEDIVAGRLVPVLTDWALPGLTMNIVFPSRTHLPARTRLFIDALVRHFRENDLERTWQQVALSPLQ